MYISLDEWMKITREEYLKDFIHFGGAAVKFVIPMEKQLHDQLRSQICKLSEEEGYQFVFCEASSTKIHMIDKLFHEVAKQINWDEYAKIFTINILTENQIKIPLNRSKFTLEEIAEINELQTMLLRSYIRKWLENKIFRDYQMSQEFRIAMIKLCMAQLDNEDVSSFLTNAIKEWLRGELRLISTLKEALIFQKIARNNARHMLFSLAHWLKLIGKKGLVINLDISRYLVSRPKNSIDGFYYSIPAVLDTYEVLRQFIDGTDEMERCLIIVTSSREFLEDNRRGLDRYDALGLRIKDEIRDKNRQNPLGSLIRLSIVGMNS